MGVNLFQAETYVTCHTCHTCHTLWIEAFLNYKEFSITKDTQFVVYTYQYISRQ